MKPRPTKTQRPVPTEHVDTQHSVQALAVCQRKGLRPKLRSVLLLSDLLYNIFMASVVVNQKLWYGQFDSIILLRFRNWGCLR